MTRQGRWLRATRLACVLVIGWATGGRAAEVPEHRQGEMVGEVTATSALLQSRLTAADVDEQGDLPARAGIARFRWGTAPSLQDGSVTSWQATTVEADGIVKVKLTDLEPATRYFYRLEILDLTKFDLEVSDDQPASELEIEVPDDQLRVGPIRTFRTLPAADTAAPIRFVVVTGMNYAKFHDGVGRDGPYTGPDKQLGYPGLVAMADLEPDFFVGTGDNVYYDTPKQPAAVDRAGMRRKWHEQFVQPRYVDFFAKVPTYWMKDDHDFRYDDCDLTGNRPPSVPLGLEIFREQVPVVDPDDSDAVTYRTFRMGKLLQVWFPENRDYRSPNSMPDGPKKTIWGEQQREWLKRTLRQSDAPFRLLVSPTPMVGPDDKRKRDNHCDIGGFQHERDEFFAWAKESGVADGGFFLVCGDRHWQYHSIGPTGFEEFSCGALVDANSRLGVAPGSKRGTDPEAKIRQPFTHQKPTGGFLHVLVDPATDGQPATLTFEFRDEHGEVVHTVRKEAP